MAEASVNTPEKTPSNDFPYFRRLWSNVVVALLAAAFVPLLVIGGGMYYYAASVLKAKTLESLSLEAGNHKEAVDRFLAERTMDLRLLSQNIPLDTLTAPGGLAAVFASLHRELPCFTDLGIIDAQGRHLAYVGPFALIDKNYREAEWFQAVLSQGVYISDVFLGFRQVPHFVIAVKSTAPQGAWILRATIDTGFFDRVVADIHRGKKGDAYLVNRQGVFQTTPRAAGRLMEPSAFRDPEPFQGVRWKEKNGMLQVMVWLGQVPWLGVIEMDRNQIFAELRRVRNLGGWVLLLGGLFIVFTVLLTTNYLIGRLETKRRSIRMLDQQLQHTSRVAGVQQMSPGFLLKLKDGLGAAELAVRRIRDLAAPAKVSEASPPAMAAELDHLRAQLFENRKAIDKFLNATRPVAPVIMDVDLCELLDNLLELLERELHFNRIRIVRNYQNGLPRVRSDPYRLRQVFQNLVLNAMAAIGRDGEIVLHAHSREAEKVIITVTDDGQGIPPENLDKIFDPRFTSKPEGMGLGLPICLNILKKLGGTLAAANAPGKGARFQVEL
ncbi:MAG: ATP-binding protein, partial [Desulfobacterales bacterium]|nr:ATP-binding protein [Desulfobacterales bacterium]